MGQIILDLLLTVLLIIQGFSGVATWYSRETHEGNLLYCDFAYPGQTLRYDRVTAETWGPWVAVDIEWHKREIVKCGDILLLTFSDGSTMTAKVLDAGMFGGRWVADFGPSVPILVDVPEYWLTGSRLVKVRRLE